MWRLTELTLKLKKIAKRAGNAVAEQISGVRAKLGMQSREASVVNIAFGQRTSKQRVLTLGLMPALALIIFSILQAEALPAFFTGLATALMVYFGLRLVRAEGPEEQARAQKVLAGCIIAGVLMALAKPLAFWATGWNTSMQQSLPLELITAVNNLLDLLMYIGVVVVIAGIIYGGIQLAHTKHQHAAKT